MGLAKALAVTLTGIEGQVVEVEADTSSGLPIFTLTGLGDKAVSEARDRVHAAIVNSGATWPNSRITVALLPADVRKVGSRFDLAIALTVLGSTGQIPAAALLGAVWVGELGLDGRLRAVRGILPAAVAAQRAGITRIIVPRENAGEAALVAGLDVRGIGTLGEAVSWLRGDLPAPPRAVAADAAEGRSSLDLTDVLGQGAARRALEVAAAGGHHIAFEGSPGAGKTMLAERLPGLLPSLDDAAALEVTAIQSVAGTLLAGASFTRTPPFQAPHHTASVAALVGGGSGLARPGAISLAHHGILFLDEAPEFSPMAVDALRQPLESGRVVLHRSGGAVTYPARFQLVLASNPCPCAAPLARDCVCSPQARRRYQHRLSGPLVDRIDLRVTVHPVTRAHLLGDRGTAQLPESSPVVAGRVAAARKAAEERWSGAGCRVNADVPGPVLRQAQWRPPRAALALTEMALERGLLSARGFDRVLRMAWTVADLAGRTTPGAEDIAEALSYRTGATQGWAA
jgi:magnesium chelatase family protein